MEMTGQGSAASKETSEHSPAPVDTGESRSAMAFKTNKRGGNSLTNTAVKTSPRPKTVLELNGNATPLPAANNKEVCTSTTAVDGKNVCTSITTVDGTEIYTNTTAVDGKEVCTTTSATAAETGEIVHSRMNHLQESRQNKRLV